MFTETKAMFLYCTSPLHMGAGTAVGGLIDNPIQRERHTGHPLVAGSGLKGAIRHTFKAGLPEEGEARKTANRLIDRVFGPERDASLHAGAVSFSDAQLVALPVRCPKRAWVYATSPTALARLRRILEHSGVQVGWQSEAPIQSGKCRVVTADVLTNDKQLYLESFEMEALEFKKSKNLFDVARWLAKHALPDGEAYRFFRDKIGSDLVLLSDDDFDYFVHNHTVVESHVRINDVSGTADDGGLFYTENLPPESLLAAQLMASRERQPQKKGGTGDASPGLTALEVLDYVLHGREPMKGIAGNLVQMGGDATTGRGHVVISMMEG